MPIRNEESFIRRSLGAVLQQDYPLPRLEVIVADGMSTDATGDILRSFQSTYDNLRVVENRSLIVATGLNDALRQSKGEIIVRVDGHTEIAKDYIRQCVSEIQRTGAANVGGRMDTISENPFGRAVALATCTAFGVGGARFHYSEKEEWVDTVYMGAWRRDVFERVGLFDEEQVRNQDDEFNYRLLSRGGKILLSPRIKSKYYNRSTLRSLWRQYFQYGYWKVRVMQKHPRQMRPRQFAPAALVAASMVALLLPAVSSLGGYLTLLVFGSYLLANLAASLLAVRGNDWKLVPLLPIAFATLHFAYGSGFLVGLVRFWRHWGKDQVLPRTPLRKAEQS